MGAFFSILTTALVLRACLAIAGLAGCAPRITAPAADVAAGAIEGTGYRFLRWKEGLAIMIWYDFRGDSGSSSTSNGGGLGAPSTYTIHGYAESEDGGRFEWEVETSDGETARFRLDGESYDLSEGTLFIVRMEHGRADVIQLERDLSGVEPNHASIVAFARGDADLAPETSVDTYRGIRFAFDHSFADHVVAEVAPGPVERVVEGRYKTVTGCSGTATDR
jgi:hypothetical protein